MVEGENLGRTLFPGLRLPHKATPTLRSQAVPQPPKGTSPGSVMLIGTRTGTSLRFPHSRGRRPQRPAPATGRLLMAAPSLLDVSWFE